MRKLFCCLVTLALLAGLIVAQEPTAGILPDPAIQTGGIRHLYWGPVIKVPASAKRSIIPVKNRLEWPAFASTQLLAPIRFIEADGSPSLTQPSKLVWPNGSLSKSGSTLTISFAGAGLVSGSGTIGKIPKFTAAQTIGDSLISESGSNVTVNGVLLPNAAGTRDFGSATLPYATIYFAGTSGTPGTNNFQFTGASTSGTRVITFPDSATKVPISSQFLTFSGPTAARTLTVADASTTLVTAASALTLNQIVLGAGSGTTGALGSLGTTTTLLHGNAAGAPTFAAVDLTADVTGILPTANGGTANAFFTVSGPATSAKTFTFPNASSTVVTGTGTNNTVPKFTTGASGIIGDSGITDDGTKVTLTPVLQLPAGSASAVSLYFNGHTNSGFYESSANVIRAAFSGTDAIGFAAGTIQLGSTGAYRWSSGAVGATSDLTLFRDAAGTVTQRNGTNAQAYWLYNTYTSATNGEYLSSDWSSNVARIMTVAGSAGGTIRAMQFGGQVSVGTDQAGATTTVAGGRGTGTGAGGAINMQIAPAAAGSGSSANALSTIWSLGSSTTMTVTQGTLTASAPYISQTATWNAAATFTNTLVNITNTSSNADSKFVDYQIGGTTALAIDRSGSIQGTQSKTLTETTATGFVDITVASGASVGGIIQYTVEADDGTDFQIAAGEAFFTAVNKAGTVTTSITAVTGEDQARSSGTLTNAFTATAGTLKTTLKCNSTSSLTQTTLKINYKVHILKGTTTVTPL